MVGVELGFGTAKKCSYVVVSIVPTTKHKTHDDNAAMAASNEAKTKPFIIGIAGGTGAGKTTFAKSIYVGFGGTGWGGSGTKTTTNNGVLPGIAAEEDGFGSIAYLSHDHYYKDMTHLSMEDRAKTNFDHPNSLDTDLLIGCVFSPFRGCIRLLPRQMLVYIC